MADNHDGELIAEFTTWFEQHNPGVPYRLRRGRRGELVLVCANGRIFTYGDYYIRKVSGSLTGDENGKEEGHKNGK